MNLLHLKDPKNKLEEALKKATTADISGRLLIPPPPPSPRLSPSAHRLACFRGTVLLEESVAPSSSNTLMKASEPLNRAILRATLFRSHCFVL